ncbi:MAG: hypothetical protein VX475_05105, partial [Myxococcota bacterium]|nr:hypothetical protein [Myxococcota bacterium]
RAVNSVTNNVCGNTYRMAIYLRLTFISGAPNLGEVLERWLCATVEEEKHTTRCKFLALVASKST